MVVGSTVGTYRMFRRLIKQAVGPKNLGRLRFLRNPVSGRAWGGPFNGQRGRCLLMASLIANLKPEAIVETGTYLGTTTEWLAAFQYPVFTIESDAENYGYATQRLAATPNVNVIHGDSRTALLSLVEANVTAWAEHTVLFYLDAHWNDDLPLLGELDVIFGRLEKAIVVIDDFEVPDDPDYEFDTYDTTGSLSQKLIGQTLEKHNLLIRYPRLRAVHETGRRRGCAVLSRANEGRVIDLVNNEVLR